MKRKGPPCSRSSFGSQSDYEDCLEAQREKRRSPVRTEADRLSEAFDLAEENDEVDDD